MERQTKQLTDEDFQKIYSDPKFRNDIAFANKSVDKSGTFWKTCSYPIEYIVTEEQIELAKAERERVGSEILEKHKNHLLFKGMGSDFAPRWEDDITNHRIRTTFKNKYGRTFFIEILASNDKKLIVDSATDIDAEIEFKAKQQAVHDEMTKFKRWDNEYSELRKKLTELWKEEPTCNYGGVRKLEDKYICTKSDIIRLINEVFECNFKSMIIDSHNISYNPDSVLCFSPDDDYEEEAVILDEGNYIEEHRKTYPLPFDKITKFSSYDQIFGKKSADYTPDERFERWTKIMQLSDDDVREIFEDTEACEGCIHLDTAKFWCKEFGLPNAFNPLLKCLGMACGGCGKTEKINNTQLTLF